MNKNLSIIVASSLEYGIGYGNKLCWNIPEELKFFRHITLSCQRANTKNCVIMGKNTWYSLPNAPSPLKDRINIIISARDYDKINAEIADMPSVRVFRTIDDALIYVDSEDIIENCFVIGGAQIYNTFLENYIKYIKAIYWSIIYDKKYECDTFIASNIIYNNFNFIKENIVINDKYVSMYGVNKNNINSVCDEPVD
jgi:dihydrofolate reductase|uniref:dihydrofolate reductase n=1 Tax=viral metagenome TaxID=1070528 RepID=A0A6C0CEW3_9ZZZZ